LVTNLDVGPTLLQVAGCTVPDAMQGLDLQRASAVAARPYVFAENWGGQEMMVRSRSEKLLWCQDPERSQFFDLIEDPMEMDNRLEDPAYAESVASLRERLIAWALFDARTQTYLDYAAPVIEDVSADQAASMAAYFAERK
jgi:arylsulfatase